MMPPDEATRIANAKELARWQGNIEGELRSAMNGLHTLSDDLKRIETKVDDLAGKQSFQSGRMVVWTLVFGGIWTALLTLVVFIATKGHP